MCATRRPPSRGPSSVAALPAPATAKSHCNVLTRAPHTPPRSFKHLLFLANAFDLIDAKELAPLDGFIFSLTGGLMGKQEDK
jgi:hypothetical protein